MKVFPLKINTHIDMDSHVTGMNANYKRKGDNCSFCKSTLGSFKL